ncbi:glycosyltransferase family 2 protein [Flavobacterium jejuense]|nr:glycosyltransferase [Flavobacterium jejuense]
MKPTSFYDTSPKNKFSIIIPFRNETYTLPKLLASLSSLNYPKELYEVILVDDASEEKFQVPNSKLHITVINTNRKSNSPKKDAIETAIKIATHDWIITTDADCIVKPNWLKILDNYIQQTHKKMVVAGVRYSNKKGFLHAFQNLDFLSLQGATIGSFGINEPFMCNGANFAYKKVFFRELNGFEGNNLIASGDDVFLLQKAIQKEKTAIGFCMHSESIIHTESVSSWKKLFFQRVRWASKSTEYYSLFGKTTAITVFLTNLCWILALFISLTKYATIEDFLLFTSIKFIVDYILLLQTSFYFKSKLRWTLMSLFFYPFFSSVVAFYALFGNYTWKGRKFKK